MDTQEFRTKVLQAGGRVYIPIPFNPNTVWGTKQRHYVRGTIDGSPIRASLGSDGTSYFLLLGAAWRRDTGIEVDQSVSVSIFPEGPQREMLAADIVAALSSQPQALAFFESLATFYRNTYIKWIESSKRPQTRAARIAEMIGLLNAGKKQK